MTATRPENTTQYKTRGQPPPDWASRHPLPEPASSAAAQPREGLTSALTVSRGADLQVSPLRPACRAVPWWHHVSTIPRLLETRVGLTEAQLQELTGGSARDVRKAVAVLRRQGRVDVCWAPPAYVVLPAPVVAAVAEEASAA
jgi:hypothetical protein